MAGVDIPPALSLSLSLSRAPASAPAPREQAKKNKNEEKNNRKNEGIRNEEDIREWRELFLPPPGIRPSLPAGARGGGVGAAAGVRDGAAQRSGGRDD